MDFPGSKCVHGSATGIAVNPNPASKEVVVFMQGGGYCTTGCWNSKAGTPTQYGAAELAMESDVGNDGNQGLRQDAYQAVAVTRAAEAPFA